MSSKSSYSGHRRSMFAPLRFPSFHSEKSDKSEKDATPRTPDTELQSPRSEKGAGDGSIFGAVVAGADDDKGDEDKKFQGEDEGDHVESREEQKLQRRRSRIDMITQFMFPSLTPEPADHPHAQHGVYRKPVPTAYPDATMTTSLLDPEKGLPIRSPPTQQQQQHTRSSSIPNILRKVRRSSPDMRAHGDDGPPLPPKSATIPPPVPIVTEPQAAAPRLKKIKERTRSNSLESAQPHVKFQTNDGPSSPRFRSSSAQPPAVRNGQVDHPRAASASHDAGSHSRNSSTGESPHPEGGRKLKRLFGGSRSGSQDVSKRPGAWIMGPDGTNVDYNTSFLASGEKVPELWHESGNVYVFLGDQSSRLGPSFKIGSYFLSTSRVFSEMIQIDMASAGSRGRNRERSYGGQSNLMAQDAQRQYAAPTAQTAGAEGPDQANIYLGILQPIGAPDLVRLIAVRNLFAFLTGQPLVGSKSHPTVYRTFLEVAALLREFDYSDGANFGEPVDLAFNSCIEQLGLADVRHSREKTIEALILGEQMKSWELYNEGFTHAVGKYEAIVELKSPLFINVSSNTRSRLERAHLDLVRRQENVNLRLESFEFPSLFAGIATSTTTEEYRQVRFKEWQRYFLKMRSFVLGHYKGLFGNWPPKARSKKNHFSESGLNRQCLKILYSDMCALYDLLVDRESYTTRSADSPAKVHETSVDPRISALRAMLTEFDISSPPVLPPIPYDVPKLPSMTSIREDYNELPPKQQARFDKSLAQHELLIIMLKSRNIDTDQLKIPFLSAFKEFEHKEAKGSSPQDMVDQRIGYWLFLYVVIQSLPMLVVDAPGLRFTEGVEYFLCEPPQGNFPWLEDAGEVRKIWYEVSGGNNIVELSADVVMFSVEATYHRSHCWLAAKQWEAQQSEPQTFPPGSTTASISQSHGRVPSISIQSRIPALPHHARVPSIPSHLEAMSPLEPPRSVFQDLDPVSSPVSSSPGPGAGTPPYAPSSPSLVPIIGNPSPSSRTGSPAGLHSYRSSIAGLEPLPIPPDAASAAQHDRRSGSRSRSRPGSRGSRSGELRHSPVPRSGSAGNLGQLAKDSAGEVSAGGASQRQPSGSTFDDILKGIEQDKGKGKDGGKKKSFF
ncbi:hypothetical protein GE09DRAFT_1080853 [Coniochaeta sp. 2T2.1]|nr:hypothetical protein GE09DRAFT_1080853 [Coniochaeta sp. 2T2.1]